MGWVGDAFGEALNDVVGCTLAEGLAEALVLGEAEGFAPSEVVGVGVAAGPSPDELPGDGLVLTPESLTFAAADEGTASWIPPASSPAVRSPVRNWCTYRGIMPRR